MLTPWPLVPLSEVLTRSQESVQLAPQETYRQVTVRMWGKGAGLRNEVKGATIAGERRLLVRAGQLVLSRIDARHGALAIVPPSLDGAIVSNDFPAFAVDSQRLDHRFLGWMCRAPWLWELCRSASEGTTNRVRLVEDRFLSTSVPLPPLDEQRRIVARIEQLAAKIEEARALRDTVRSGSSSLCRAVLADGVVNPTPMRELVTLRSPDIAVTPDQTYHFAGVYSFGRGVFRGPVKKGSEFSYAQLTRLRESDFTYPKLMAWEGALGIVPPECHGLVVSTEFPVFEVDEAKVLPEVLDVYFKDPSIWPKISGASTGTNVRRRRLNPVDFLNYSFPLPGMAVQQRLRSVKRLITAVAPTQEQIRAELDALLPSILDRAFKGEL